MTFIDNNGEPALFQHSCSPERTGEVMTTKELEQFSVALFYHIYKQQGYQISQTDLCPQYISDPIFSVRKKGEKEFIVKILTTMFPDKIESPVPEELTVDIKNVMNAFKLINPQLV